MGRPLDRDLALLHRLEQRRLGPRRRPVDLVDEEDVREDRARRRSEGRRPRRCSTRSRRSAAGRACPGSGPSRRSSARATARASSVLPVPGTSSTRTWPSARSATRYEPERPRPRRRRRGRPPPAGRPRAADPTATSPGRGSTPVADLERPAPRRAIGVHGSVRRREPPQDRRQDARPAGSSRRRSGRRGGRSPRTAAPPPSLVATRDDRRAAGAASSPSASPRIVYASRPVRPERRGALAGQELERQHAHPDEVRAVDPLVALGDDGPDAEQRRPLGRPVARRARAVLAAGDDDERHALGPVAHRGVVDERLLAVRQVDRVRALPALGRGGCAAGCWRTCRASSPRGGRAGRRTS